MDGLAEWHFAETGAIQVIRDARAGSALLTLVVGDLRKQVAVLEERGLTPGAIDDTTSDKVLFAEIANPEGNTITLVEQRSTGDPLLLRLRSLEVQRHGRSLLSSGVGRMTAESSG